MELLRRHLQKEQLLLVPADDGVAAVVLPQLQQLREKPGGEEAGVAPDAAVAQGGDLLRLGPPAVHQLRHALPPQQGLVAHLKQHPIAVPQLCQTQFDGVADAVVRVRVVDSGEVELPCQAHDLRVLGHHHHFVKFFRRDRFQRPEDQAPAPQLGGQLVVPEPPGVAGGHYHTADLRRVFHVITSF